MNTLHSQHAAVLGGFTRAIFVLLVLLIWAGPAAGQGGRKSVHLVKVHRDSLAICRYSIETQTEQDVLHVGTREWLIFLALGVDGQVSVENDVTNQKGTSGPSRVQIPGDVRPEHLLTRPPVQGLAITEHKVFIECCRTIGKTGECIDPDKAYAEGEDPRDPVLLPGGPRMIIED